MVRKDLRIRQVLERNRLVVDGVSTEQVATVV